jgi:hypothetical protein
LDAFVRTQATKPRCFSQCSAQHQSGFIPPKKGHSGIRGQFHTKNGPEFLIGNAVNIR